jgi:DNA primase
MSTRSSFLIEHVKGINLVDYLTLHYGLSFTRHGMTYKCLSPFTEEKDASFCVSVSGGHWLFNDYSSNKSGSILDFVMAKEGIGEISSALDLILDSAPQFDTPPLVESSSYDIVGLYTRLKEKNDLESVRAYLLSRGISFSRIDDLVDRGILLHNRYDGISYCCFAVFDSAGDLVCLDNHQLDGDKKFVLGKKFPFSLDWALLKDREEIFVCEGIIDYLSMKELCGDTVCGVSFLGSHVLSIPPFRRITLAFDNDRAGISASKRFQELFPLSEYSFYDLHGFNDPNEYLQHVIQHKSREHTPLNSATKFTIVSSGEKSLRHIASDYGIHHSTVDDIRKEGKEVLCQYWDAKSSRIGRPPKESSRDSHGETIAALEKKLALKQMRIDWLELQLKWEHERAAEAKRKKVTQLKKKRKGRKNETC